MFTVDDSNRLIYWSNWKEVANLDDQNWYSNGIQSLSYADTMKVRSMYPNVSSVTMYVLTSLETGCLSSMQNLRRARFPHITSVGQYALASNNRLSSIECANAEYAQQGAFMDCTSLTAISIPNLVEKQLKPQILQGCINLLSVDDIYEISSFQTSCLANCEKLQIDFDKFRTGGEDRISVEQDAFLNVKVKNSILSLGQYEGSVGTLTISSDTTGLFAGNPSLLTVLVNTNGITGKTDTLLSGCRNLKLFDSGNMTSLGQGAIGWCQNLVSAVLSSVQSFETNGYQPLYGCSSLQYVYAPLLANNICLDGTAVSSIDFGQVQAISGYTTPAGEEMYGFAKCDKLKDVKLGITGEGFDNVLSIGRKAFAECGVSNLVIGPNLISVDSSAFEKDSAGISAISGSGDRNEGTVYWSSMLSSSTGTAIGQNVLYRLDQPGTSKSTGEIILGCENSVLSASGKAGAEVTAINDYAFYNIGELSGGGGKTNWALSANRIVRIGDHAFDGCKKLNLECVMRSTKNTALTSIGSYAFYGSSNGTGKKMEFANLLSVGDAAFMGSNLLFSLNAAKLTSIGVSAFANSSANLSAGLTCGTVKYLGEHAFDSSGTKITQLVLDSSLSNDIGLGTYAFANCKGLGTLTFAKNAFENPLGEYAFAGSTVSKVNSADKTSGKYPRYPQAGVFANCKSLADVNIFQAGQELFRTIGDRMFAGCSKLTKIASLAQNKINTYWSTPGTAQDSITYVGSAALSGCTSLTAIGFSKIASRWQLEPDALTGSQLSNICFQNMSVATLTAAAETFAQLTPVQFNSDGAQYGMWYQGLSGLKSFAEENGVPFVVVIDIKNHCGCNNFRYNALYDREFQKTIQTKQYDGSRGYPALVCYVQLDNGRFQSEDAKLAKQLVEQSETDLAGAAYEDYPYIVFWKGRDSEEDRIRKCLKGAWNMNYTQAVQYFTTAFGEKLPGKIDKIEPNSAETIPTRVVTFNGWGIGKECRFGAYTTVNNKKAIKWFKYSGTGNKLVEES